MGITERKERNKTEMRKRILDTAMKLFLEEGFGNVSLRRIADKIEYSPATIYLYFKDKDEILYALHTAGFEELYKRQQKLLSIRDLRKRIQRHGEVYIKFALENPEYYNLMFILRSPARKIAEGDKLYVGRRSYEFFREDVGRAIKVGVLEKGDVDIATLALWSMAHGIVSLILRNRCPMAEKEGLSKIALGAYGYFLKTSRVTV